MVRCKIISGDVVVEAMIVHVVAGVLNDGEVMRTLVV